VLLYSKAKLGKTTIVAETTPDPKFIFATEEGDTQGLQSISHLDIDFVEVRDWTTGELVLAEMARVAGKAQYKGIPFEYLINDSYSCNGQLWMKMALDKLGWKEIGMPGPGHDPRRPYQYVAEKGRQATKQMMALPCHLICIAREGQAEEGEGENKKVFPCIEMPGAKLFNELPGGFDAVVRLRQINDKRVFVTEPEMGAIAGIRIPATHRLPKYIKPHVGDLIAAMLGDRDAAKRLELPAPARR
jgi:hypothetical protein